MIKRSSNILDLANGVEEGVEDEVEPHQPDEVIGNRQFEQSLDRLENLHFLGWMEELFSRSQSKRLRTE